MPTSTRCGASPSPRLRSRSAAVRAEAAKWRTFAALQRFVPADHRPHRGAGLGEGARLSRPHHRLRTKDGPRTARRPSGVQAPGRGSQRLLAIADEGEVHDTRLWTAIAEAVGAYGNTTALVGTPEQVRSRSGVLRRWRDHVPHPRLRTAAGRDRIRPRADPDGAGGSGDP